jgi:hypothetical protein
VLSSNTAVTVAQGGTGATTLTGILKGNGTSAFTAVTAPSGALVGDTDTQTLTNKTISKASNTLTGVAASGANSDITSLSALATPLSVDQGGTGAATLTANNLLVGNGTSAVSFLAPGTSGNILQSDGTTWGSVAKESVVAYFSRSLTLGTGITTSATSSLTTRTTGLFNVAKRITVNQLTFYTTTRATAGTTKVCVYSEDGATKLIDITTGATALNANNIAVSPAVTLEPGNYYVAIGCATTCSYTLSVWTSISVATLNGASVPSGKLTYEGTVTHSSGGCDSTLGTITAATNSTPMVRFDN